MSEAKRPVGRPRHYDTPEAFEAKLYEYQAYCVENKEPVTWTGLALFMGFSSRQSIDEYAKYDGFSDCVKKAKTFVEWHYEMRLCGDKPTGAIFALKNMGWRDKPAEDDDTDAPQPTTVNINVSDARARD